MTKEKTIIKRSMFIAIITFVATCAVWAQRTTPAIKGTEIMQHLRFLASDELAGRKPGTPGGDSAAAYIAREFARFGLEPGGENGSFFQPFEFTAAMKMGKKNTFAFTSSGENPIAGILDSTFRPLTFSSTSSYEGEVVFAGYGITTKDTLYDDYAGLQVAGKAVIVLRGSPDTSNPTGPYNQYLSLRFKTARAKELGASAVIFVTGEVENNEERLVSFVYDRTPSDAGIPVVSVTRSLADQILEYGGVSVNELQNAINASQKPKSMPLPGVRVALETDVQEVKVTTSNVIGILRGNDPALRDQYLVIGAHYDHLGMGGEGSGSTAPDKHEIHNGADDNASGTSALLDVAEAFASRRKELQRTIVFMAFAAEESGLLGSAYFANHPTYPLDRTAAMLNMDMVGRLQDRKLTVFGTGTSPGFETLLTKLNSDSTFLLTFNRDGFGPSDQSSFYAKNIPVLHFFTNTHTDYHNPSDDADKINVEGIEKVARYVFAVAESLQGSQARPQYVKVEVPKPASRPMGGVRVYTGAIPDFSGGAEGLKLAGVRDGAPIQKAGLMKDDIVVKFGTVEIRNIEDYMYALGKYRPGDSVEVQFKRNGELKSSTMHLIGRN